MTGLLPACVLKTWKGIYLHNTNRLRAAFRFVIFSGLKLYLNCEKAFFVTLVIKGLKVNHIFAWFSTTGLNKTQVTMEPRNLIVVSTAVLLLQCLLVILRRNISLSFYTMFCCMT